MFNITIQYCCQASYKLNPLQNSEQNFSDWNVRYLEVSMLQSECVICDNFLKFFKIPDIGVLREVIIFKCTV